VRQRMRGLLPGLVLALLPVAGATGATGTEGHAGAVEGRVGSPGAGDPYFPRAGNGGYDVARYDVRVRYDFGRAVLSGRTRVIARATAGLDAFHLDLLLPVRAVLVDGVPARWSRPDRHEVLVRPAEPLRAGEAFRVVVRYAGSPARVRWRGATGWWANRSEVVALGQPHAAPWWFAASDHPSDKARLDVHLTVPRGRQAVSGGTLRGVRRHGKDGRWSTWHWRAAEPMAPYLAFFAAGDFVLDRGVTRTATGRRPWWVAVSRQLPRAARADALRLLRRTPGVVWWLERRLGPYPFATTGGLTTGLPLDFALETQTRPVYPSVGDRAVELVVHEQAHQWFGNAVTLRSWADIWLNEGFATFLERHWAETHGGPDLTDWLRRWYDALAPDDAFWKLPIGDPGPDHLFDWEVYQRGAMAVQALRQRVGEEAFWRLLRRWLAERDGGHGSVEEFRALAEEVTGEDLSAFFDAWLLGGVPPPDDAAYGLG
jgi:aminopeptidase N